MHIDHAGSRLDHELMLLIAGIVDRTILGGIKGAGFNILRDIGVGFVEPDLRIRLDVLNSGTNRIAAIEERLVRERVRLPIKVGSGLQRGRNLIGIEGGKQDGFRGLH